MKNKPKILISVFFLTFLCGFAFSQQKPVILSPKVGEKIDSLESRKYSVLKGFDGFSSAVFYRTREGKYFLTISFIDNNDNYKDSIIELDEKNVFNVAYRLEFFDYLVKGREVPHRRFTIDSTSDKYFVRTDKVPDLLPFVNPKKKLIRSEPWVGIGASISYISVDLNPVKNFFNEAENSFRQRGWNVPRNNLNFKPSVMYTFNFYIRLVSTFGLDFETGKTTNADVDFWYSAGYLCYNLDLKKPAGIKPFAGIGVGKYSYYAEAFYYATVDPNGSYLEKISSGAGKIGYLFKGGFEVGPSTGGKYLPFCFNVFALYSYFPEITSNDHGYETKVKLGGFRAGCGLRVYL